MIWKNGTHPSRTVSIIGTTFVVELVQLLEQLLSDESLSLSTELLSRADGGLVSR